MWGRGDASGTTALPSAPRLHALLPGLVVGGRFRVERRVASGAMGEVWAGVHTELRMRVALKTLRKEVIGNHELVARFSREAFLIGRIQSDHVPRVLDFVADPRLGPVLVTEFIEGPSLASILESRRLTVEEGIDLGIDVVSGLRELHRAHIVHRDVKPANILLRDRGGQRPCAVFVDFGVSRLVTEDERDDDGLTEITTADRAVGTVEYMAPEQILSSRSVTEAADLYAVGAILYRAVSGRHVFDGTHGVELMKQKLSGPAPALETGRGDRVATGFAQLVARALASSPCDRYELADEMLADLSLLRDSVRRAARDAKAPARERRGALRGVVLSAVALALVAGLASGAAVGIYLERRAAPRQLAVERSPAAAAAQFAAERCTVVVARGAPSEPSAFTVVCGEPATAVGGQ